MSDPIDQEPDEGEEPEPAPADTQELGAFMGDRPEEPAESAEPDWH